MIVKIPHVGDVEMDTGEAVNLADEIRGQLRVEIPLSIASLKYAREDLEGSEPVPAGVEGYPLNHHAPVAAASAVSSEWPPYTRVDPDLRTPGGVR